MNGGADTADELAQLRRRLDRNAHGHISYALRLRLLDDAATIISVVGGVSLLGLSSALLSGVELPQWLNIGFALAGVATTVVGVMQAVWKPGERAHRHRAWSARFGALESECRLAAFGSADHSYVTVLQQYDALLEHVDLVPERIWRRSKLKLAAAEAAKAAGHP